MVGHRVTSEVEDLRKLAIWKWRCRNLGTVRAGILSGWQSCIAAVWWKCCMLDSSRHQSFLYLPRTEIPAWENSVCDGITLLRPPLGRQTGIYVGGSSEPLPSVGSDMLEIRPVSSCLFYGHTLRLIPNIKRLVFLKYQQLLAPWLEQTT